MEKKLLTIKNVKLHFTMYDYGLKQRVSHAIKNLNLEIKAGEVVSVFGASGSGKSLLAHAILGILPNNAQLSGDIFYKGQLLTEERKRALRGKEFALVPQSVLYLDPLKKIKKQVVDQYVSIENQQKAFLRYGLEKEVEDMYPHQLSGGMARRVLIATAVAGGAELIIADEPTPGLTEKQSYEVMKNFRELADEGRGILLITHDIVPALSISDKIVIFYDGQDIDHLSKEAFHKGETNHDFTKALRNALPQYGFNVPVLAVEELVKRGVAND